MADNKKTELLKPVLQLGKECICPRVETLEGDGDDFFKMLEKKYPSGLVPIGYLAGSYAGVCLVRWEK